MNITSWNVRGINDPSKRHGVLETIIKNKVDILGLLETKIKNTQLKKLKTGGYKQFGLYSNHDHHASGRICVIWKPTTSRVEILEGGEQYVHCRATNLITNFQCLITFVYAYNGGTKRQELWDSLGSLAQGVKEPWLCMGDFNVVLKADEKIGEINNNWKDIEEFGNCLQSCGLTDLPYKGLKYTWCNMRANDKKWSKLDRILSNELWMLNVGRFTAEFLPFGISDHSPAQVMVLLDIPHTCKSFKFLNTWTADPKFSSILQQAWQNIPGSAMFCLFRNLSALKPMLRQLHTSTYSNISERVRIAKMRLEAAQVAAETTPRETYNFDEMKVLNEQYSKLKKAEMSSLTQRAKITEIKEGDTCSKYFFAKIKERRLINHIGTIKDKNGNICSNPTQVTKAFLEYYEALLGRQQESMAPKFYNFDQHHRLQSHTATNIQTEEIRQAVFSINPNKSPGPDGFNSHFFRETWDSTSPLLIKAIQEFFESGRLLKQAAATTLVLIPKVLPPKNVFDYRPIACCTTVYKTISKILANRLKVLIPQLVGPEQAAFVMDRKIHDNIFLSQELIRKYTRKHISPRCLIKVDIKKAFDSVSWEFLEAILLRYGINTRLVRWIMACIRSPYYTLAFNGTTSGFFKGGRGLRQGDPLSPYLFVLCMEFLSRELRHLNKIKGFSYHPKCAKLNLNHLVFADDLLIFCRADVPSVNAVVECLNDFAQVSGLESNPNKSNIYFGGITPTVKKEILESSGYIEGEFPFKYLGLPLHATKLTSDMFQVLVMKVKDKLSHWANSMLSYAGKGQIINSIIFGICNFWGAGVLIPKGVIKQINRICKDFFWNNAGTQKKLTLQSWARLCTPKNEGGMGFKELLSWNRALLLQRFMQISHSNDIWSSWMRAYYIREADIWYIQPRHDDSPNWKALLQSRDYLVQRLGSQARAAATTKLTVTELYRIFTPQGSVDPRLVLIWDQCLIPKYAFTCSLALQNRLLTIDNLQKKGLNFVNRCILCQCNSESITHLFFSCQFSTEIWKAMLNWMGIARRGKSLRTELNWIKCNRNKRGWKFKWFLCAIGTTVGAIWKERNARIFEEARKTPSQVINRVKFLVIVRLYKCVRTHSIDYLANILA